MAIPARNETATEFALRTWPPRRAPNNDPRARLHQIASLQPAAIVGVLEYWLSRPSAESKFCVKS